MSYVVRSHVNLPKPSAWTVNRPDSMAAKPKQLDIVTRRYEISWLDSRGEAMSKTCVAPALPVFEQAFGAFAQGTLIQTADGHIAVEDLQPGDKILCASGKLRELMWVGAMMIFPNPAELGLPPCKLYRVTEGSFGHDRQSPDLILGSAARILPGHMATDSSSPLHELENLADGEAVIAINPVSQIRVFHVALSEHSLVRANGVLCESYHPGMRLSHQLPSELHPHFMNLFPHLNGIDGFGPLRHNRRE